MTRSLRRGMVGMAVAAVGAMIPAGLAWACVGLVLLTTSSATVAPGGTVTAIGKDFAPGSPVLIHLDAIDGPVLATVPPLPGFAMTTHFSVPVAIPASVNVGQHILIATENEHNMNTNLPARAVIYVGTAPAAAGAPTPRPATVLANSGPSGGVLALLALAVAAVSLSLFGAVLLAARRPRAQAAKAP